MDNSSRDKEIQKGVLRGTDISKKKRGKYAPYGPKLRAEIAKFASDHTNLVSLPFISCFWLVTFIYLLTLTYDTYDLTNSINTLFHFRRLFDILKKITAYRYQNLQLEGFERNT